MRRPSFAAILAAALACFSHAVPALAAPPVPPLIEAARAQDLARIATLLKKGADANLRQPDGATALHWAAHWNDVDMAEALIRVGADVNLANALGVTPLSLASGNASSAMVAELLKAGADPNRVHASGESPLMMAARRGSAGVVALLLAHQASVNAREAARGYTPLMAAAAGGHSEIVRTLIRHGADIQARTRVAHAFVNIGNRYNCYAPECVARVAQGGSTALSFAARHGDVATARLLVEAGADPNESGPDGVSVLVLAVHSGNSAMAAFLLAAGADPNADAAGYSALHAAVLRGEAASVRALLERGANVNARLKAGTAVRRWSHDFSLSRSWVGATPLWLAAKFAEVDILTLLTAAGADPSATTDDGTTALTAAAGLGSGNIIGGSTSIMDRRERPVHAERAEESRLEDERRSLRAVTLLTDLGADVNAANRAGDTALHGAASNGFNSVIQLLAQSGARLEPRNKRGITPLALASGRPRADATGRVAAGELLRQLGARE